MRILKNRIKYIITVAAIVIGLLIAVVILSGSSALKNKQNSQISISNGLLDLTHWNPNTDGLLNLSGEWEFYWQRLLTYDDLQGSSLKPDWMADLPSVWNNYKINGKSIPGFGYATYKLKVKNAEEGQALAIRIPTVSTAYSLSVNDQLIASNGKVGVDKQHYIPEYRPVMVEFISPAQDFEIILQVANFSYARGGVWYPIFMGSVKNMVEYDKTIGYKDLFLIGAFFIMALYYLSIFFMRREDKSSIYFVLLCLIAIGRTVIYGDYLINRIFPWVGYNAIVAIDYVTVVWFPVVFVLLIGELFPGQTSRKLKKLFIMYAALMSLFIILFPIHIYTSLMYPIDAVILAMVVYAVVCSARAFLKDEEDSAIILLGALIAALGGVHDVLYQNNIISSSFGELSSFGFLILLFLQALILARRFSKAFNDARIMSEKLMKLDKLKDEFLANTSHELRTPLNAMINIADGLSRGTEGSVNENQKTSLSMIAISGKRLTNLINNILDYAKLKNFDLKMNLEVVSLKRIVESVMNELGRLNKTEGVQMLIDIPNDLPNIYADENRLLQILYNLVGNALKFTETGYIKVSATKVGDTVEICIEDTGIGIPEDKLDIIFESFQQLEASLTRRNGGTGLGLSITKYLIEAHGGKIRVESKVGIGSKFYFSILASTEATQEKSGHNEASEAEIAAAAENSEKYIEKYIERYIEKFPYRHKADGPHIMLVDDNKSNLKSLADILKMSNYSVTAVTSSREFLEEFNTNNDVSLVILDVMLPELSGYAICREIRKSFSVSELPVLMLTARTTTQDIVTGMEAGANDYLGKPFDLEELLARVKTLIQLKASMDKALAAELAFLQAQIKPHFLYNALNTFVSISRYDIDKARNLIIEFGNYLRRSFDFRDLSQLVPLKNELEFVRAYLEIEKARFEERIEVAYDLPDDLEVRIPILMLQPIIENAVIHGILPKDEGGRIEICIKRDELAWHFKVKDNGIGMEPDKQSSVSMRKFGSGVGLLNIDNRLRKLYGKGLQINSIPGRGTVVEWSIPKDLREGEKK